MLCSEIELAFLIPKESTDEGPPKPKPFLQYKGTEYRKTVTIKIFPYRWGKAKLKRFYHWLSLVWFHSRARKCRKVTFIVIVLLFLFLIFCVVVPLAFKHSLAFQRYIVFDPIVESHDEFDAPIHLETHEEELYYRPRNTYLTVDKEHNIKLGLWDLQSLNEYGYARFGDSSQVEATDEVFANDGVKVYKWLLEKNISNSSIYIWGDKLGAAVATRVVTELEKENINVTGLILENPFLTMSEYLRHSWFIAKMTSYTWWYKSTITYPLEEKGWSFNTKKYFDIIKCPILLWNYGSGFDNPFNSYVNTWENSYPKEGRIIMNAGVSYYFTFEWNNDIDNRNFFNVLQRRSNKNLFETGY
ncbi:hypothetical protein FQA39_LY17872 [Lamprigera yunnana]|nr:hypothetical protein FQA39_LY17872 [Lamprigera yunnana]